MELINKFISNFTGENFGPIIKLRKEYYLVNENLVMLMEEIKNTDNEPKHIGVFLGTINNKLFEPSIELLKIISQFSEKKVYVNDKAEWLFLCGRDIFGNSITKANAVNGLVLIQNKKDENLGFGKIIAPLENKNKVVIKNILDRGAYLRMER